MTGILLQGRSCATQRGCSGKAPVAVQPHEALPCGCVAYKGLGGSVQSLLRLWEPAVAAGKAHPWLVWNGHPLCPPCPFVCHVIMCPIKQCCARHVQCAATWVERKQLACANGASAARWLVSGAAIVPRCNHVTEDSCTCLVERVVCNGPWYGQLYDVISGAALPPSMHSS